MTPRFSPGHVIRVAGMAVEEALRTIDRMTTNIHQRIDQLQRIRWLSGIHVQGIELPDQTNVPVRHSFGRPARAYLSTPYAIAGSATSGSIRDRTRLTADEFDPNQYVVLFAEDWNTTMYVDAWIVP